MSWPDIVHLVFQKQLCMYLAVADLSRLPGNTPQGNKILMCLKSFLASIYYPKNRLYLFYVNADFMQRFRLFMVSVFLQMADQRFELAVSKFFKAFHYYNILIQNDFAESPGNKLLFLKSVFCTLQFSDPCLDRGYHFMLER